MDSRRTRFLSVLVCVCLCLTLFSLRLPAASAETEIGKVLATTSYTPVALMDVAEITAATSTSGVYITEYGWYDLRGGYQLSSRFGTGPVEVSITFATHDGFIFSGSVDAYLNNERCVAVVSPDRHYMTLTRTYDPMIWLPSVMKSPGDEYLDEGGLASFVATAKYAEGFQWFACNPATGEEMSVYEIPEQHLRRARLDGRLAGLLPLCRRLGSESGFRPRHDARQSRRLAPALPDAGAVSHADASPDPDAAAFADTDADAESHAHPDTDAGARPRARLFRHLAV